MRTYQDIDTFSEWTTEEQNQFALAVTKGLIMDTVRKANSGHSGGPMSSADFTQILFTEYLNFDPNNPDWFNRDRFVLSAGHESALIYAMLTQIGWLNMDDIQNFRQLHSRTPGHPEVEIPGVEATTGPLGQGFGMAVGMATAESMLRARVGDLVSHFTYVVAGDGDFQEPITLGAGSMAGHWGLSRLIVFYDSNNAQISGKVDRADSTNYAQVFEGFGWHVQEIDGHDHEQIREAIEKAQVVDRPSLIIGTTIMAQGSANMEGDHETHGAPLPQDEIDATKEKLGLPDEPFYLPEEVLNHFQTRFAALNENVSEWNNAVSSACEDSTFKSVWNATVMDQLGDIDYPKFEAGTSIATRKAFGTTLDKFAEQVPSIVGGSADLEPSNYTGNFAKTYEDFTRENRSGRNLAFGVREFPMAAAMNGMALHGGVIPFGGTFLVFADYERPALRLAAIQQCRVIHEFTHDSFWVGEDGPTHQPIEHAMALRTIPNFNVFRPADAKETAACFRLAIDQKETPSALLLTRQGVKVLSQDMDAIVEGVSKGAYAVVDCENPDLVFLATGSEVGLAMEVAATMNDKNIRVVSMPCWEIFEQQSHEYINALIPRRGAMKISMEAGITMGWDKYIGPNGLSIGIDHFGASAPGKDLAQEFGFTADQVESKIRDHINKLL
ncbi:MAG: transketolase [Candidatus Marinimicrobia bacterium]|jgi:transketolase|nr:transketolase [Candidatus Neomarinimicrobiota bacterium]MBT3676475.1 transketolase [Candidatus Neomarinimicrobiota bacterium]MBT3763947.1 transketolase [Candidatus Neomarinimicrobiota bacterium]MBT4068263.1 transketolase [Candidatus Neomarinimicrobiota bacterium]MBT4269788.1 transketolase [Candidatus Neomarinimicrobiota bacterium]